MSGRTNLKTWLVTLVFFIGVVCTPAIGRTIYVDANTPDNNDGSSWAKAYKYLQDALADANSSGDVNEIWVAQGIYQPDQNSADSNGSGDRMATFELIDGVSIYGGFPSSRATWEDRDPNAYETILSGDLNSNDVQVPHPADLLDEPTRSENSYHVVTSSGTDETAVLNGFTIAGGASLDIPDGTSGGGIYNYQGSPTLINCSFSHNSSQWYGGGGMYNDFGSPTLINCTFSGNAANYRGGGGMCNWDNSNPTLINCTFSGNSASVNSWGGGMCNWHNSNPTLINCTFNDNSVDSYGGGICDLVNSSSTLINCTFSGNSAFWGGGGGVFSEGSPTLTNCTFSENTASRGGGIHSHPIHGYPGSNLKIISCTLRDNTADIGGAIFFSSDSSVSNCIVRNNWATQNGGGIYCYDSPMIYNCIFSGNAAGANGGAIYCQYDIYGGHSTPMIINCTVTGNTATQNGGGMFYGDHSSPTISNCTLSGNTADYGGGISCYFDSHPTINNCILWSDVATHGDEIALLREPASPSTVTVNYSDVQAGSVGVYVGAACKLNWGTDNIDADPNFVRDPNDGGDGWGVGDNDDFGNLRLSPSSPCIDDANNAAVPPDSNDIDNDGNTTEPIPWDLDKRPRFADGDCNGTDIVDMGAYEFTYAYFGDFDGQCDVDFVDFSILANQWLEPPGIPSADIAPEDLDGIIDGLDLAVLVEHWLEIFP